jgi:hypothetical protein
MVVERIVIHIGPPKTGSSALQTWLVNNRRFLLKKGFYYPEHSMDTNNVSSGNVLSVFSSDDKGELNISRDKVELLLVDFNNSGAETLLLSSEYFFLRLDVLSKTFPEAIFVGYVRNPLDFMESDYNQSIKRHGNSKTINLKPRINASILRRMSENVDDIGEDRFHLRAYHSELFPNRDIVHDFMQYLGISGASGITGNRINSSYCYEAMEVKRWLNQFEFGNLSNDIDLSLQKFERGTKKYSLITPVAYKKYRVQSINTVIDFCKRHNVFNSEELVKAIKKRKHSPYFEQELNYEHAKIVVDFIREHTEARIFRKICRSIKKQKDKCMRHVDFIPAFTDSIQAGSGEKIDISQPERNLRGILSISAVNGYVIKWFRKLF